jgi:hypothetical protein
MAPAKAHGSTLFRLRFDPERISHWAGRYKAAGDEDALAAGRRIAAGEYQRAHLQTIFKWKTNDRGKGRLADNTDAEIADALRLATLAHSDRCAMAVLLGLHGVAVPVAAAILTAINPARYTVIDFRALRSLGYEALDRSIDLYLKYLGFCRELADRHGLPLRTVDRALWQYDKEHPARRG